MKLYSNGLDVDPMVIVEVPLVESIFSTCSLVILSLKRISPFTVTLSGEEEAISKELVCSVKLPFLYPEREIENFQFAIHF